jgi:uncharacterized protein
LRNRTSTRRPKSLPSKAVAHKVSCAKSLQRRPSSNPALSVSARGAAAAGRCEHASAPAGLPVPRRRDDRKAPHGMLGALELTLAGAAAVGAGFVNALAGGGSLITFPTLMAIGVPALAANVTNTVALCPGYFGGTLAQLRDLRGQRRRLWLLIPAGLVGGIVGGVLLLKTSEAAFRALVPFLILAASALLALQQPLRNWLQRRAGQAHAHAAEFWTTLPVALAAVYGGYFGAGLGVILLATLGLLLDDSLTRLNALKQSISLATNVAAAVFFVFSGQTVWPAALVMAVGALLGGMLGGRLAQRVKPGLLRAVIVVIGTVVGVIYLVRR